MSRRLRETEYDPFSGETKQWYINDDGSVTLERKADLRRMIDHCKQEANLFTGFSNKLKFHKVASIPPIMIHKLMQDHNLDFFSEDPAEKKRLERIIETEYPFLKTHGSKLWRPVKSKNPFKAE